MKRAREPADGDKPPKKPKTKAPSKPSSTRAESGDSEWAADKFKGYSLHEIPREAWPQPAKMNAGQHGYTVSASNGAVLWSLNHNMLMLSENSKKDAKLAELLQISYWCVHKSRPLCSRSRCPASKAIECLLKNKAFVVKKLGGDGPDNPKARGQYTWSKQGGASATWEVAKKAARWPQP